MIEEPKTPKSKRLIGLSPDAILALRSYREMVEADMELLDIPLTGERLVFSKSDGSPLLPNTVTHAFGKMARRAGMKGITLHSLRHSHASVMLQEGVSSRTVADRARPLERGDNPGNVFASDSRGQGRGGHEV